MEISRNRVSEISSDLRLEAICDKGKGKRPASQPTADYAKENTAMICNIFINRDGCVDFMTIC